MDLLRLLLVALTVAVTTSPTDASAKVREDFERVIPFSAGGSFEIENSNGSIHIKTWSEDTIRVEAEKQARSEEDLDDIEIVIDSSGDSVSIETIHHRRRDGGKVSYVISMPAEADVSVSTANGSVTVEGIHGRVDARSTNGTLRLENIVGEVKAKTTNGSIRTSYDRATDGDHTFKTVNGSVRVYLPSDAGGEFDANTLNGSIKVDFATKIEHASRRHMRGSFGNGGSSFEIETVNGSVKILSN
jgi:DUF4097 and DUF4098 domain-containing protein YvlB